MARFLNKSDELSVLDAIRTAENNTSGEIRVHMQAKCKTTPYEAAKAVFEKLGMTKTKERNGILFFVAYKDRKFSILGDKGINDAVPDDFWSSIVEGMSAHFREDRFAEGLTEGILKTGAALKDFFPCQTDDVNELPDDVSYE